MNVEAAVIVRPFSPPCFADPKGEVAEQWARVATLKEAEIGARMVAARDREVSKPAPNPKRRATKPHNAGRIAASSHAARILRFLFLNGSGRSSDKTPFRAGIDDETWRSTFSNLKGKGYLASEAGGLSNGAHVWRLTDAGRALALDFQEISA